MDLKDCSFIIASFYTVNTPYEQVIVDYLGKSLKELELPHIFYPVESLRNWNRNTAIKPTCVRQTLENFPTKNVVFLDADATILTYPKLFDEIPLEYDMAAHWLDWATWYNRPYETKKELLSGTLFFRNNAKVKALVRKWELDAQTSGQWEQKCLQNIIEKNREELNIYALPLDYIWINTLPDGSEPHVKSDSKVIVHHQVSRKYKAAINL